MRSDPVSNKNAAKEFLLKEYDYFTESFHKNEEVGEKRVDFFTGFVTAVIGGLVALINSDSGISEQPLKLVVIAGLASLLLIGWVTLLRLLKRNKATDEFKDKLDKLRELLRNYYGSESILAKYLPFNEDKKAPEKNCTLEAPSYTEFIARTLAQNRLLAKYGKKFTKGEGKNSPRSAIADFLGGIKTRTMGGLVDIVAMINALLCAGLAAALIYQPPECIESIMSKIGNADTVIAYALTAFAIAFIFQRIYIIYYHFISAFEIKKPWKHTNSD